MFFPFRFFRRTEFITLGRERRRMDPFHVSRCLVLSLFFSPRLVSRRIRNNNNNNIKREKKRIIRDGRNEFPCHRAVCTTGAKSKKKTIEWARSFSSTVGSTTYFFFSVCCCLDSCRVVDRCPRESTGIVNQKGKKMTETVRSITMGFLFHVVLRPSSSSFVVSFCVLFLFSSAIDGDRHPAGHNNNKGSVTLFQIRKKKKKKKKREP